ncbi:hypothetical protein, conserved [Leishmania donovani]|uniref:Uncharacterized protein n=1 Tax=Leishmania donovani TaxID=5661 RepID=A0A3Q8ILB9_LEIDO|nr:hypothetical protein, conserved [Leishmania donovani]AYU83803.1 hypothetical protein LdCL_360051900 [Leishmania donovani]TPP48553.1 hypothetical protein CGC21_14515 [Leishmania donovani]CBZ38884.1 hypothetical protein, conserved [Leishmania donovani]
MNSTTTISTDPDASFSRAASRVSTPGTMSVLVPYKRPGQKSSMAPGGASQQQRSLQSAYAGKSIRTSASTLSSSVPPHGAGAASRGDQSRRGNGAPDGTLNSYSSHPAAPLDRPRDEEFDAVERRARMALESIATRDEDLEPSMGDHIEVLQSYRTACEARAMYREAYLVQQVLRNLRLEEESRHVRGITEQQMEERRILEEAHRQEFREFHHSWNARIDAFEEEQLDAELALLERQNEELIRFQEEMRNFQPRLLRYSRSLLESRLKQQTLAKQRDYVAAQAQKAHAEAIEVGDIERFEAARMSLFERREYAARHRHQQELYALRTKVESRRLYLERYRKQELDVLLQRYINARRSMESQQNIVRNKTGTLLLKHACNMKTDNSGTAVLVESAGSGAFGTMVQRRQACELRASQGPPDGASASVHDGSTM